MKECSNTCDAFTHKKIVIKVLCAPTWNLTLADFAQRFATRRQELKFALTIHSFVAIDLANRKLLEVDASNRAARAKLDRVLEALDKLAPLEEKSLRRKVEEEGGINAPRASDTILEGLLVNEAITKDSELAVNPRMKTQ